MNRREAKDKGEKERYTHLDAEFQRIARRDKKAFLSNQSKEIEENNRMGKSRDHSKGNYKQGEKTALRMGENNSKRSNRQGLNLKNTQATPPAQLQKNK